MGVRSGQTYLLAVEMHITSILITCQCQIHVPIERIYATSYLLAIVVFALFVTF